jgi:glycosyltransferase involved in cell wall biosynthesis
VLGHIGLTANVSESEARFGRARLGLRPDRQCITPNGVDCARFQPVDRAAKREIKKRLGLPGEGILLGTVGRFSPQKDPLTTYQALARARPAAPDLSFVWLGQGELSGEADAFVSANQMGSWTQRLPYFADPAPFYQALDGFILGSLYEGLSYSVLEALATNLPLILTRCPGNIDLAKFELSHLSWAEPGDPASLAHAILEWRAQVHETPNHREIALHHFERERCFGNLREAYLNQLPTAATPAPAGAPRGQLVEQTYPGSG